MSPAWRTSTPSCRSFCLELCSMSAPKGEPLLQIDQGSVEAVPVDMASNSLNLAAVRILPEGPAAPSARDRGLGRVGVVRDPERIHSQGGCARKLRRDELLAGVDDRPAAELSLNSLEPLQHEPNTLASFDTVPLILARAASHLFQIQRGWQVVGLQSRYDPREMINLERHGLRR